MTEKQYQIGLKKLIEKQPNNPLLNDLSKGFSKFNVIFLKHALDALPKEKVITPASKPSVTTPSVVSENPTKKRNDVSNPVISALMREQSDLFTRRNALSNSLHKYPFTSHYDEKRAVIMDNIRVVQRKIGKVMGDLAHAREYGRLPPPRTTYPVPHDLAERERKKVSLRGSISHKRRDLEILRGSLVIDEDWDFDKITVFAEDKIADEILRGKILRGYEKLNDLKTHLKHVEKAIEADHIHAD
jgi:hypothetical protein